jgi:GAF domain-containing protein
LENQAQFNSDTSLLSPEELNSSKSNELLLKISQELATKLDLEMLLPRILQLTVEFIGAASGSLVVLNETGDVVMGSLAYKGIIQKKQSTTLVDKVQHGLAGWVVENKQPVLVDSTQDDPRWTPGVWEGGNAGSRSAICVPLISQDRVAGVLTLTRMEKNRFTMEDLSLLTAITLALSCTVGGRIQSAKPTK